MEGDRQLLLAASAGDSRAWSMVVDRYKRLVYSIPARYSIPADACDDIFQDVFTLLLKNLEKLRDAESVVKWLMVTTHRECWRWARRQDHQRRTDDRAPAPTSESPAEEMLIRWERQHLVRRALEDLGGRCQKLLEGLYLARLPMDYNMLAQSLGLSVGSIGPTRRRCLGKLAGLLKGLR